MKKTKKVATRARSTVAFPAPFAAALRDSEFWLLAREFCELHQMNDFIQNSYVLSRFWAWVSQIELTPHVRVPVPRFLTRRDP